MKLNIFLKLFKSNLYPFFYKIGRTWFVQKTYHRECESQLAPIAVILRRRCDSTQSRSDVSNGRYCFIIELNEIFIYHEFKFISEVVRAMHYVISQGWAMYWGTARWSPVEVSFLFTKIYRII